MEIVAILKALYCLFLAFFMLSGFVFWMTLMMFICDWFEDTREIRKQITQEKHLTNRSLCDIIKENKNKLF